MRVPFRRCLPAVICCLLLSGCDSSTTDPGPAPNLSGVWVGTLTHGTDPYTDEWNVRLEMEEPSATAPGYLVGEIRISYRSAYLVRGVSGEVDGRVLLLEDGSTRGSSTPGSGFYWCEDRTFDLEYRQVQGRDRLVGEWTTPTSGCSGGRITLDRQ